MSNTPPHAKKVFSGKIFDIWQWEQEMFDGSTAIFERAKRLDAVTVVPITPEGRIILTRQLQPHWSEPAVSLPGGMGEIGETPLQIGKRELMEETGHASSDWRDWNSVAPSERIEYRIHTFIARDCTKVGELELDPGEKITLFEVSFDELLDIADSSGFRHRDIQVDLVRAKYHQPSRRALEALLFG